TGYVIGHTTGTVGIRWHGNVGTRGPRNECELRNQQQGERCDHDAGRRVHPSHLPPGSEGWAYELTGPTRGTFILIPDIPRGRRIHAWLHQDGDGRPPRHHHREPPGRSERAELDGLAGAFDGD